MSKLIEEINEVISKINEKLVRELDRDNAQDVLREIRTDLKMLGESSGENFGQIVKKKVDELKKAINANLNEEEASWLMTQDDLNKIKSGLAELKNKITELEKPQKVVPTIVENESETVTITLDQWKKMQEAVNQLIKWNFVFGGKTPEEVVQDIKNKKHSGEKVNELFEGIHNRGERWTVDCAKGLLPEWAAEIPGAKFVIGFGAGAVSVGSGALAVGIHELDKTTEDIKDLVEKTGTDLKQLAEKGMDIGVKVLEDGKEFTENMVKVGAEGVENFRKGAENLIGKGMDDTTKIIEKNLNIVEKAVEKGVGFKAGILAAGIGMGQDAAIEKEVEILRKQVADKDAEIKRLQEQVEKQSSQGQNNLLSAIEFISRGNTPIHSRAASPEPK